MCKSPVLINAMALPCHKCALCRANRHSDLIGRCLAEQSVSSLTLAVTLTYRGFGPKTAVLHYRDVQLFLKKLRKAGYKVRYICAGEYGSLRGRAHWHVVLFFRGKKLPRIVQAPDARQGDDIFLPRFDDDPDARYDWPHWDHGFSYFQESSEAGFAYLMKYAMKDLNDPNQDRGLAMSKLPPLGHDFFMQMALDLVQERLPIHDPTYRFRHVQYEGKARVFWLQGRMREMFFEKYFDLWALAYSTDPPLTEFIASDEREGRYHAKAWQAVQDKLDLLDLYADGVPPPPDATPRQLALTEFALMRDYGDDFRYIQRLEDRCKQMGWLLYAPPRLLYAPPNDILWVIVKSPFEGVLKFKDGKQWHFARENLSPLYRLLEFQRLPIGLTSPYSVPSVPCGMWDIRCILDLFHEQDRRELAVPLYPYQNTRFTAILARSHLEQMPQRICSGFNPFNDPLP